MVERLAGPWDDMTATLDGVEGTPMVWGWYWVPAPESGEIRVVGRGESWRTTYAVEP